MARAPGQPPAGSWPDGGWVRMVLTWLVRIVLTQYCFRQPSHPPWLFERPASTANQHTQGVYLCFIVEEAVPYGCTGAWRTKRQHDCRSGQQALQKVRTVGW